MLAGRRDTGAAYRFLRKALRAVRDYPPSSITTDKLASYPKAIRRLRNEGLMPEDVELRDLLQARPILKHDPLLASGVRRQARRR